MNFVTRTALAVGLVSSLMVGLVGVTGYLVVRDRTIEAEQVKVEIKARGAAARVETRLLQAVQSVDALSRNLVIRNALLDSAGREIYVKPILDGVAQVDGQPVSLSLLDFQARPVIEAGRASRVAADQQAWLRARIESATPGARLVERDGAAQAVMIAYPVLLPYTRSVEGAMVMRLPVNVLLHDVGEATGDRLGLRDMAAGAVAAPADHVLIGLALPPALGAVTLALDAGFDRGVAERALARLQWQYLVLGLLCVLLLVALSIAAAHRVAGPIRALAAMAQRISGQGPQAALPIGVPTQARGEVRVLAESLQQMVERLRAAADAERRALQTQFRVIFDGMSDGAVITDERGVIESANPSVAQLLGRSGAELLGRDVHALLPLPVAAGTAATGALAVVSVRHPDGRDVRIEWTRDEFLSEGRRLYLHRLRDISEREANAAALREAHARLDAVLSAVPDLWFVVDEQERYLAVSRPDHPSLSAPWPQVQGRRFAEVLPAPLGDRITQALRRAREDQCVQQIEYHLDTQGGAGRDFEARVTPMQNGQWLYLTRDITARKRAEAQIREALREKEVLLKEIYHRVKNNLQVVASLLNLQGRRCTDEAVRQLMDESAQRVKSMALVHEQLYQRGDLSSIDFAAYLGQLAAHLSDAYGMAARRVALRVEAEPVVLGIEAAVPLGLITTELVSNSCKHAYADQRAGTVLLRLRALPDGRVELAVSDEGVGLPSGFSPAACDSLGMQLVVSLTEQVGGQLEYGANGADGGHGARFAVSFAPAQVLPATETAGFLSTSP